MSAALDNFVAQAQACAAIGSPFTAELCRAIPDAMGDSGFARRIRTWPGEAGPDALALRACGGFHALVLAGIASDLARIYPPHEVDASVMRAVLADAIADHDAFLTAYLDSPPQTNEAGRSSMLLGAALHLARATRLPLTTLEVGASAGLNLWFSRYAFDLGHGLKWGRPGAPLTIASEWSGAFPALDQSFEIVAEEGCDRNPLDPRNADDRLRLLSYVWPDQPARLDRMRKALDFASRQPTSVERADAAEWVDMKLSAVPRRGVVRMLYHTVVWQYLPEVTRARISAALARAGEAATPTTPLAWFRFENDMAGEGGLMELTLWPGGETQVLGRADFHGRWVKWA